MRFSRVMRVLVASAAATTIAASGASAVEMSANAIADGAERVAPYVGVRSVTATTAMKLAGKSKAPKGKKVKVTATLTSNPSDALCFASKSMTILVGSKVYLKTTGATGTASVTFKLKKKTKVQANFAGDAGGVHPSAFVCSASSATKVIKVKK